jgi:hypothetical protein
MRFGLLMKIPVTEALLAVVCLMTKLHVIFRAVLTDFTAH